MQATAQATPEEVQGFLEEYFEAWKGTDVDAILAYFTDSVEIDTPLGKLIGKEAVRDYFVQPLVSAFPGNVHAIQKLAFAPDLVAAEWIFQAVHAGPFAGLPASGRTVALPGCSFYEHDLGARKITAGRIYFDVGALLKQLGAEG
jgi:steroid delta-isomerase-like uncharacterized protein